MRPQNSIAANSAQSAPEFQPAALLKVEIFAKSNPLPIEASSWLAVRCRGQTLIVDQPAKQRVFAHTSPVYVRVENKPNPKRVEACAQLKKELMKMLSWACKRARCENDQQRERLTQIFEDALAKLQDVMANRAP